VSDEYGTRVCGHCGSEDCGVAETRLGAFWPFRGNVVRRRRKCRRCCHCWWTLELNESVVIAMARKNKEALAVKSTTFEGSGTDYLGED